MKILGLSVDVPTCTSAVLMEDGHVLAGTPEERLNREKWSPKFPALAIKYCLAASKNRWEDIDAIGIGWNPLINVTESSSSRLISASRHKGELFYSVPANLLNMMDEPPIDLSQSMHFKNRKCDIHYVTHHDCHAAHSFFESNLEDAAIVTCDGYGEKETSTVTRGYRNKLERVSQSHFPNSIGMFYGTITEYLGYRHDSDEWKVMALGAYGTLDQRLYKKLRALFSVNDDLSITLDTTYFEFDNLMKRGMFDENLVSYLGLPPRMRDDPYLDVHYDLANATQQVFEDVVLDLCEKSCAELQTRNLCLGGGSFMNSLSNGKMASSKKFDNIYIPYAPNDAGTAIGAAYFVHYQLNDNVRKSLQSNVTSYIGPGYSDEKIEQTLKLLGCNYRKAPNVEQVAAQLLVEGKIIGWFQGRMEFGERALGNRSILADPRSAETRDRVNAIIKFRESYRPFAPAILMEHVSEYFDVPEHGFETPFMEKVFNFRKEKVDLVPSVAHADGTGRLQSVTKEENERFYTLISEFYSITGVPIVLNTSLNRNGEPIVCSPEDALAVFYGSGLDCMVLHDFVVEK